MKDNKRNRRHTMMSGGQNSILLSWASDYQQGHPWWKNGIISKCLGSLLYLVTLQDGIACKRHVEQIKGMDTGPKASDTVEKESECTCIGGTANGEDDISIDEEKEEEANDTVVESKVGLAVAQPQQTSMAGSQSSVDEMGRKYPSRNRCPPSNPGFVSVF